MAVLRGSAYTYVYPAYDRTTGGLRTGDASNQTVYLSRDGGAFVQASSTPVEILLPNNTPSGIYRVTLTASEMTADSIAILVVSSTSGVLIPPCLILTERGRLDAPVSSRATALEVWQYTSRTLTGNVTVGGYASGMSPAEQLLSDTSRRLNVDEYGNVFLSDEDHATFQNDVVAGLESIGYSAARAQYLDELASGGTLHWIKNYVSQIQFTSGLVRATAVTVQDKADYALSTSANNNVANAVWNMTRGSRAAGTFGYYLDAQVSASGGGGGGGGTDWTADERAMIRYVLGIDGDQLAPSASTPGWLKDVRNATQRLQFDASNRILARTEVNADKAGYALSSAEHNAIAYDVQVGLNAQGYSSTRASYLDAPISSRLPASSYVAPDNAAISAIKNKTDNLSFVGGNVNARAAIVADKTGYRLDEQERLSIAQAVWNFVVEAGYSALNLFRLFASVLLGKASGGGTGTVTFRDVNDTRNRVVASVDQQGNRTSVTLDGE